MFRDSYQRGLLTIFFSKGPKPFNIWDVKTKDGYVTTFLDQEIKTMVVELRGNNVSTTYMICPKGNQVLGITMPLLVMVVKNLHKYFSFEVTILDETSTRRRFRVSNFQSSTQILPLCTVMPLCLSTGWNQIQFNLAEFCRRAYQKQFIEVQKVKVNANIRIRRIYFTEKLLSEDELPADYKLFFPLPSKPGKAKKEETNKENIITKELSKIQSVRNKSESKSDIPPDQAMDLTVPASLTQIGGSQVLSKDASTQTKSGGNMLEKPTEGGEEQIEVTEEQLEVREDVLEEQEKMVEKETGEPEEQTEQGEQEQEQATDKAAAKDSGEAYSIENSISRPEEDKPGDESEPV